MARQSCDEAIKGNRENVAKIIGEVLLAFGTCGISYIPKFVGRKKGTQLDDSTPLIPENTNKLKDAEEDNRFPQLT